MPYTLLLFTTRLPGTTPAAFRTHYESTHIPLLKSLAGAHFPRSHTRHYISRSDSAPHDAAVLIGTQADFDYDCFAKLVFDGEAGFQAFNGATIGNESAMAKIKEDEAKFLDVARTRAVVVGAVEGTSGAGFEA